jgi:murein L,D-transpeptidase YafK
MFHLSGISALIRAGFIHAVMSCVPRVRTLAVLAGLLALGGCYSDDPGYQLPARAMKELSPEMIALLAQKNMPKESPVLVRIFKEESELEVWKQDTSGQFQLLKVYPICRWSGELGPKKVEGDRQAPEGFYAITPGLMNPNSNYYLAINMGFPNAYDKANGYSGAFLMVHGDCSSRGCYAMTDEQIGEIYSLAREAFLGGQRQFQIQAYPFRMTPANLARHRNNPNIAFWKMLKEGNDHFEATHLEPKVDVCDRHYVFDAQPPAGSTKPLSFSPTGRCPTYEVPEAIAGPATEKSRNDDYQYAQLVSRDVPTAPIVMGTDGGMNRVFASKLQVTDATMDNEGHLHAPPIHPGMPAPTLSAPHEQPSILTASNNSSVFNLFNGKSSASAGAQAGAQSGAPPAATSGNAQVATNDAGKPAEQGSFFNLFKPKPQAPAVAQPSGPPGVALAGLRPDSWSGAKAEVQTGTQGAAPTTVEAKKADAQVASAPKSKTKSQDSTTASITSPAKGATSNANTSGVMAGAQPTVPAGSFDGRWAGLQ